jgi:hypothetical protein
MPWDLALPLLVCLATLIVFIGIYWSAKKILFPTEEQEH